MSAVPQPSTPEDGAPGPAPESRPATFGPATSRRAARSAETRARIEAAALTLFDAVGYDATTVQQIAEAAGVGERTVYRHYPTKAAIVLHGIPEEFATFVRALHDVDHDVPPLDGLIGVYQAHARESDGDELELVRARLVRDEPTLRTAWLEALEDVEPGLRYWWATRNGLDVDSTAARASTAAILAIQRTLVLTFTGDVDEVVADTRAAFDALSSSRDTPPASSGLPSQ